MTKTPEELAKEFASKLEGTYKDGSPVAHEAVDAFLAGYEAGRAKWIKCSDKLPAPSVDDVLVIKRMKRHNIDGEVVDEWPVIYIGHCIRGKWFDQSCHKIDDVTHWMLLPPVPGEK